MHEAETRIPRALFTDRSITYSEFRLWCWLDHLCQVHNGPIHTNRRILARQLGIDTTSGTTMVTHLVDTGWLRKEWVSSVTNGNAGFLLETIHRD